MQCLKCSKSANNKAVLKCHYCSRVQHYSCMDIPETILSSVFSSLVLTWKCDNCVSANLSGHSELKLLADQVAKLDTHVSTLSSTISLLREEIGLLRKTNDAPVRTSNNSPINRTTRSNSKLISLQPPIKPPNKMVNKKSSTPKTSNVAVASTVLNLPVNSTSIINSGQNSTIPSSLSPTVIVNNTLISDDNQSDTWTTVANKERSSKVSQVQVLGTGPLNSVIKAAPAPSAQKMLYISRCEPSVLATDIVLHIFNNLNVKIDFCIKLVNKEADINSYNFVSFKAAVPVADFERFLNPMLWSSV